MNVLAKLLRNLTSLDTPKDQSLAETAVDLGAGFVPGIGTAQALRDFERARRDDDALGMVLSGVSVLPVLGGAVKAGRKVFGGIKGATRAELENLERALKYDPKSPTWNDTGWMKTPEGSWMNEIDDSGAVFDPKLGLVHPELYRRYPEAAALKFKLGSLPEGVLGEFHPENNLVVLSNTLNPERATNVALHEVQHVVDKLEGRRFGSNPDPGGDMDRLAAQLRYGYRAQKSAKEAQKAQVLMEKHGLSPEDAARTMSELGGEDFNTALMIYLLRNPHDITNAQTMTNSFVDKLRKGNVQTDAFSNYVREPSEARARATQSRQFMPAEFRKVFDPDAKTMTYYMENPVPMSNQLRLFTPINL